MTKLAKHAPRPVTMPERQILIAVEIGKTITVRSPYYRDDFAVTKDTKQPKARFTTYKAWCVTHIPSGIRLGVKFDYIDAVKCVDFMAEDFAGDACTMVVAQPIDKATAEKIRNAWERYQRGEDQKL